MEKGPRVPEQTRPVRDSRHRQRGKIHDHRHSLRPNQVHPQDRLWLRLLRGVTDSPLQLIRLEHEQLSEHAKTLVRCRCIQNVSV